MVEEAHLPMTITVPGITDEEFERLCSQYEDCRIEYTAGGELLVMPPTDPDTGFRNTAINGQLFIWWLSERKGVGPVYRPTPLGYRKTAFTPSQPARSLSSN